MASPTRRRMSLPPVLGTKEGQRIKVPEGGELVCYKNAENQHLFLKVEYSREMMVKLSSSIFCHQRPPGLQKIAEEVPELLGLPRPIPLTPSLSVFEDSSKQDCSDSRSEYYNTGPLHLYTPMRGPVTEADESMRMLSSHRELHKRLQNMSLQGELSPSGCPIGCFESP